MKFFFTFLDDGLMLITTELTINYDRYFSFKSKKLVKVKERKEIKVPECINELFKFTEEEKYRHIKADLLFNLGFSLEDIRKWNDNLKNPMDWFELKESEGLIRCNFYSFYGVCIPDDICFKIVDENRATIFESILERNSF